MSHFARLKTQFKNRSLVNQVCRQMGWTAQIEAEHVNGWSQEKLENVLVLRDANKKVMGCIDAAGNVIHDSYYMGTNIYGFAQNYAATHLKNTVALEGGQFLSQTTNAKGEMVIELEFN